jgi:hypothetical protein
VITASAQKLLSDAAVVDPYGAISVRQERIPLGIEIQRFNGIPVPAQRWDISAAQFGAGEPASLTDIPAQFAPGQFMASRSDDEALTAPAFLPLKAGVELVPAPAAGAEARPVGLPWEERVIAQDIPMPAPAPAGQLADVDALEIMVTAISAGDSGWWIVPDQIVTVDPVVPVAAAFSWSMAPVEGLTAATGLELGQAVDGSGELMVVEAWEVTG